MLAQKCSRLDQQEALARAKILRASRENTSAHFGSLAKGIKIYVVAVLSNAEVLIHAELMSICLLTILEMWAELDRHIVAMYPLLQDYHHGFPDELLDTLQFHSWSEMQRVQQLQAYLRHRASQACAHGLTPFSKVCQNCFAVRYFDKSSSMQQRLLEIEENAKQRQVKKLAELEKLNAEYDALKARLAEHPNCKECIDEAPPFELIHDQAGCTKCYLNRAINRLRINVCEHPLPDDIIQAKTAVFELCIGEPFCAYRDATWAILGRLAHLNYHAERREPRVRLQEFRPLRYEASDYAPRSFGLASTERKSFNDTHYRSLRFPVDAEQLFVPCGISYAYHDEDSGLYAHDVLHTSFGHHFRSDLPADAPLAGTLNAEAFRAGSEHGLTSNQVIASQFKCPRNFNLHEYLAAQSLYVGTSRRWYNILQELGSSTLNFSSEVTAQILARLCHETGSAGLEDEEPDILRMAHAVFKEESFCEQLLTQIKERLSSMAHSFREHNCMEILLMLLLRLYVLSCEKFAAAALDLIELVRSITRGWMDTLRSELISKQGSKLVSATLNYALWAALLCRRTFDVIRLRASEHPQVAERLDEDDLVTFLVSSLVLHDSLRHLTGSITLHMRRTILADIATCRALSALLRRSISASPTAVLDALASIWPQPKGSTSRCREVQLSDDDVQPKFCATIQTDGRRPQSLVFGVLDGHVLLDGHPIGRLPEAYSQCSQLRELVGDQTLYCFASDLPQMSHVLHVSPFGNQIHVGTINGQVTVRVCSGPRLYQVLDRKIFRGRSGADLPHSLIEDCIHFMDLRAMTIQCRKKSAPWNSGSNCWQINFRTRRATKGKVGSVTHLVDVYSFYFGFVASILRNFEDRQHLIVQQPANFSCLVELPRLELTWFINTKCLLACKQLGAEIDPNQDAGTLYGLESAIVLRDMKNPLKRSVLVPAGTPKITKRGFHVSVFVQGNGNYLVFGIDDVLGRLTCAADSRVITFLTLLHAITSFIIPDPLLRRLGTEEALSLLESYCHAPTPLNKATYANLQMISALTPCRHWYPEQCRTLQTVTWDARLSTVIQHESYEALVNRVLARSNRMSAFHEIEELIIPSLSTSELNRRGLLLRSNFFRADSVTRSMQAPGDARYQCRHAPEIDQKFASVMKTVFLWPSRLPSSHNLSAALHSFSNLGGFQNTYSNHNAVHYALLADHNNLFGPVASFCKGMTRADLWTLAFTIAPLAFQKGQPLDILYFWLAFAFFDELKTLVPPSWASYSQYRGETRPTLNTILPLLKHGLAPTNENTRLSLRSAINHKQTHGLQSSETNQFAALEAEMHAVAQHLVSQWPTHDPSVADFDEVHLDLEKVLKPVIPEWQRFFKNLQLSRFLDLVQPILDARMCDTASLGEGFWRNQMSAQSECSRQVIPDLHRNLLKMAFNPARPVSNPSLKEFERASIRITAPPRSTGTPSTANMPTPEMQELSEILHRVSENTSAVRAKYFDDMRQSLAALQRKPHDAPIPFAEMNAASVDQKMRQNRGLVQQHFSRLQEAFSSGHKQHKWLNLGGLWPAPSPVDLLESLRPTTVCDFGSGMKAAITDFGSALADYQHALRLKDAYASKDRKRLAKEIHEGAKSAFSPTEHPEWLLIELEANLRIRADQIEIAVASTNPPSQSNSVLQANMGLGKTSVIMPCIVAHLAGRRKNVVRVIVPRALLSQTSTLLHGRVGRLLGSNVLHLPYSRQVDHSEETTETFLRLHKGAKASGSIILAAPEQVLSFKVRCFTFNVSELFS